MSKMCYIGHLQNMDHSGYHTEEQDGSVDFLGPLNSQNLYICAGNVFKLSGKCT